MKLFFLVDSKGKRHIIVANDQSEAVTIATNAEVSIRDIYEIKPDTYDKPGFLISDK